MDNCKEPFLLYFQLILFLLGRIMDDIRWYDIGIHQQIMTFTIVSVTCMTISVVIQIIRKKRLQGWFKILFFQSQIKFFITWAIVITINLLYFNIFGCKHQLPSKQQAVYYYVLFDGCLLNAFQVVLTNLNYSLICNTKSHRTELFIYEVILFIQIIYNGVLLLHFIEKLQGQPKDYSILLVSLIITNQILIMDLLFRAAYQDRERQQQKQHRMLGHHKEMNLMTRTEQNGTQQTMKAENN